MEGPWAKWLVGFLAAAFMAWAGVVWSMAQDVMDTVRQMEVRITGDLAAINERQRALGAELLHHQREPAHGRVLLSIQEVKSEVARLTEKAADNRSSLREIHRLINDRAVLMNDQ